MIGVCRICRELITGGSVPAPAVGFTLDNTEVKELQEFDKLGQAMVSHMMQRHEQGAAELAAVSNLAMKVYVMRFADSSEKNFEPLRVSWMVTIRNAVFGLPSQAEAESAPASSGLSSPVPSGS